MGPRNIFIPYSGAGTGTPMATRRGGIGNAITVVIAVAVILAVLAVALSAGSKDGGIPASTAAREKVSTGYAYDSDCVVDEIGWINNESRLSKDLQSFYKATGCQPFVYMKAYDPACSTDEALADWAAEYYDTNFKDRQHVVFYAYACETPDPNDDSGNGWQNVQLGTQSSLVMDAEALDIFWAYVDADWNTWDASDNDGMYADVFSRTAGRIMQKTATGADVAVSVVKLAAVVAIGATIVAVVVLRHKRAREEAAETAAILSAPLGQTAAQAEADELASRYSGGSNGAGTGPGGTAS